ncbi:MAG: polysaccharide biosynthesis protein [Planctomycetota bacterium]
MNASFRDKTVLITGGTGTIGSEILQQVLAQQPRVVRIFSRDETKHAQQRVELPSGAPVRHLIGDVRDLERLRCALDGVDVVFHAAALKHVPACEYNPFEAAQTNVLGTQNLIQGCREVGVNRLVYISTSNFVAPIVLTGRTRNLWPNVLLQLDG